MLLDEVDAEVDEAAIAFLMFSARFLFMEVSVGASVLHSRLLGTSCV